MDRQKLASHERIKRKKWRNTFIPNTYKMCWHKTLYHVEHVVWTSVTTSRDSEKVVMRLVHATGNWKTWCKVMYQHTMYVITLSNISIKTMVELKLTNLYLFQLLWYYRACGSYKAFVYFSCCGITEHVVPIRLSSISVVVVLQSMWFL